MPVSPSSDYVSRPDFLASSLFRGDAIELYQSHYRALGTSDRLPVADCLNTDDWQELGQLLEVLGPLKSASLRLQAAGSATNALWEQLATSTAVGRGKAPMTRTVSNFLILDNVRQSTEPQSRVCRLLLPLLLPN